MRTDTGQTVRLADYAPTPYAAPHVTLMFALHPTRTVVKATTTFEPRGPAAGPLELVGDGLTLVEANLDGAPLTKTEYEAGPDGFVLKNPPQKRFELGLVTIVNPDENTELMGLYRSNGIYCTQCEAEGFRRITYAYDRPDVLSTYEVWIMADAPGEPPLLSNGNLVNQQTVGDRLFALWRDPFPKPTYLFALVAGDLGRVSDSFTTRSGRKIDVGIYVERGNEPRAAYAMDALKRSMRWDEVRFGREYDLDVFNVVAVSDFNMGAMENKGLNVFNDRYVLADPKIATDTDYAGIEAVIAHEYFHNWTGNRITCRDWFQLCLKEGLTVFRDQEFTSDERSRGVKRIEDVRRLRLAQFREDAGPLRHPVRPSEYGEISNLYTATVYEKGAEIIRMIHTFVGEEGFRHGMDRYFDRYDGTAATVEDFVGCFDLSQPGFMRWYEEAGTPRVSVSEAMDGDTFRLTLTQEPPEGASLKPIPVRLAIFAADGAVDLTRATVDGGSLEGDILVLSEEHATLTVPGLADQPVTSLFRGFSAPVHIDREQDAAYDLKLLARDDDPFSLWDAAQRLVLGALVETYRGGKPDLDAIADVVGRIAIDDSQEPAFRAYVLQLPPRATLIETIAADVDPDAVDTAHRAVSSGLGRLLTAPLGKLRTSAPPADDDVSPAAAGRRALRNAALQLLTMSGDHDPAVAQAEGAGNMTNRLAALGALVAANAPETDEALARFHETYAEEPLALDKYFALQALRSDPDALARVRGLMEHPRFSLSNPNRVRSLIGAFAQNVVAFHRADGSGHAFIGDMAIELDGKNPQIAARLLTAFGDYRRYEEGRAASARAVLERVGASARSSDVADIVRRLLK
jgi:aminopeptidase N